MSAAVFPMSILLVILLTVPLMVGVYVYRDANRRGMNALLWTLVAAFGPVLVGLIIYLLVRGNYSDLRCPQCDETVKEQFVVCPKCGIKLRATCPNCAMPVEPDWKVCPKCTQPLAGAYADIQPPVRAKDKSIGKLLAVVLIVPALLIGILVLSFSANFFGGSSSLMAQSIDEYFEEMNPSNYNGDVIKYKVYHWLERVKADPSQAHALQYAYSHESGKEYYLLVFVPGADHQEDLLMDHRGSIFGTTLSLDLRSGGKIGRLYNISYTGKKAPNLKIKLDGRSFPCEVSTVDYNPTQFYIVPQYDEMDRGDESFWLPQRITVVKLINNHNEGSVVIDNPDIALKVLSSIDGAPYLDLWHSMYRKHDGSGGYDFKDGFDIIIEYKARDDLVLHDDMIHCLVLPQYDGYYIIDDRAENGRFIRETDEQLYNTLSTLFE